MKTSALIREAALALPDEGGGRSRVTAVSGGRSAFHVTVYNVTRASKGAGRTSAPWFPDLRDGLTRTGHGCNPPLVTAR